MDNANSVAAPLPSAKTSGLAIASLVLAVSGLFTCGLTAIIGLILGIVALCAVSKRADQLKGRGLAIAGIVTSVVVIVMILFLVSMMVLLMPVITHTKMQAKRTVLMSHARQICLAMHMYCDENIDRLPPVDNWPAALIPYLSDTKILESPFAPHAGLTWTMNKNLNGCRLRDIKQSARTVLIFQVRKGSPPAGGPALIDRPPGQKGYVIGFLDGHVELVQPVNLTNLVWITDAQNQPYDIIR